MVNKLEQQLWWHCWSRERWSPDSVGTSCSTLSCSLSSSPDYQYSQYRWMTFFFLIFFQFNTNNFQVLDSKIFKFLAINIFHILDINLDYWSWCSSRPDPSRKISIYNSWLSISSRALFSISTIDHGAAHPQGLTPVGHRCRKNWFLRGERWTQRWGMVISSWPIALIFLLVFFRNLHG